MSEEVPPAETPVAGLCIVVAFILSRHGFYLLGGRYITKPLAFALQYLDPVLLQQDLLQSLFYLHSQPPLFNLLLGAVLKASGNPPLTFMLLFQTAGLVALLCLYGLFRSVRLPPAAAAGVTLIYMLNPTVLLYEHLLYYTYMESVLISMAAFCLLTWCRGMRLRGAVAFWLLLGFLGGMRSMFHPVFFVGLSLVLGLCMYWKYRKLKTALIFCAASLVAIGPLGLLMAKNHALYGFWGTSSWDGMNLWTKTSGYGPEELEKLYRGGIISRLALDAELEPFRALEVYADADRLLKTPCHHPADCNPFKSTGKPNFNHAGYSAISRQLMSDSLGIIAHDPARFAFQTLASYSLTLWHASDSVHGLFHDNMELLAPLETVYRYLNGDFLGVKNRYADSRLWLRTAVISLLYAFVYAFWLARLYRRRGRCETDAALAGVFCLLVHAFTIAVSSVVEFGENNRFRFPVDGVFAVLLAGTMAALLPTQRHNNKSNHR